MSFSKPPKGACGGLMGLGWLSIFGGTSHKEFLAIRRAIKRRSFYFVEITTGETRHIQQIYIDEPSMHHCPQFVYLKRVILHAYNNSLLIE